MKKGGQILAILVTAAVACCCGSSGERPEQQPAGSPAAVQTPAPAAETPAPAPPAATQIPTSPAAPQTQAPPAATQAPPVAPPTQAPPATTPATPPAQAPPPATPVPPAAPPPQAPPATTPVTPPAQAPPPTTQAPREVNQTPPTVAILKGNPMGAVRYPHAAHAKLVGEKCDVCHHASRPEKPLANRYQKCQDCHTTVATPPMKTKAQAAFHDPMARTGTCIDCHLKENAGGRKAPVKCGECHKKENQSPNAVGG